MVNLVLDEYEVVNLREGLLFLRAVGGDTGDWLGQLLFKLDRLDTGSARPNQTVGQQRGLLAQRIGFTVLP